MSRGRTPRTPGGRSTLVRAVEYVEMLEERRMLTTLSGGEEFNYLDANLGVVRIRLVGNITAEFTAARVNKSDNRVVIRDLIQAPPPGATNAPTDGADLFNIYIAQADSNAQILITKVPNSASADRLATPYTGSVGIVRAFNGEIATIDPGTGEPTGGGEGGEGTSTTVTPDATGNVWIGARTRDLTSIDGTNEANIPIIFNRNRQGLGVRPAGRGIYAGIQTAAGVNVGRVLIGGTLTGIVNFQGSVRTFYAGNILTGNTSGLGDIGSSQIRNNFQVAGDLQNLFVGGSIGTTSAGNYSTGFELRVGGRLGNQHVVNAFNGSVNVFASPSAPALNLPFNEEETYQGGTAGARFLTGFLSGAVVVNNAATGETAPFGYTSGTVQGISWTGTLQGSTVGDGIDNYSLPLMAGQSATLELQSAFGGVQLGVFDPLGRLIATDSRGPSGQGLNGQQFQITAKVPGIYRLAVVSILDNTYTGAQVGGDTYTLNATGLGNLSFGGATVGGITHFRNATGGVAVRTGDLGGWYGVGDVTGSTLYNALVTSPIYISRGNLRALYGNNIGKELPVTQNEYLNVNVPRGSVGYIRAQNQLDINPDAADVAGDPVQAQAVGGDYQRVEAGGDLNSNLVANGNIGTIIAGSINSGGLIDFQPSFSANTDGVGDDGNIDMIYVAGDVGDDGTGPAIYTGRAGNLKYFHVGGVVRRDQFFGNSVESEQTFAFNQSVRLTDDSGAVAVISPTILRVTTTTPTGGVASIVGTDEPADGTTINNPTAGTDPNGGTLGSNSNSTTTTDPNGNTVTTSVTTGRLGITPYAVRTGGSAIVRIRSGTGLRITTLPGTGGSFDVGDLATSATTDAIGSADGSAVLGGTLTTGTGTAATTTPTLGFATTAVDDSKTSGTAATGTLGTAPLRTNRLLLAGSRPVNVFNFDANGTNITTLSNSTGGEVVGTTNVASLGFFIGRTAGRLDKTTTADVVVPTNLTAPANTGTTVTTSPFTADSVGVGVTGNVLAITTSQGVGNIQVGGTLGVLQPNNDGKNARGVFDGIDGSVEANVFNSVNLGEGIAFGGTGGFNTAGLFADTTINSVVGVNADVRGPIISRGTIKTISLTDGSIIGTRVGVFGDFAAGLYLTNSFTLPDPEGSFSLNQLSVTGNGGIIGSGIYAGSFGTINASGFGIIASTIAATAIFNRSGTISAGGLGIRLTAMDIGSSINAIAATGNGRVLDISQYSASVRQTSRGGRRRRYDGYTGRLLDGTNDLNRLLGTSATRPAIRGVTNSGVLQDIIVTGEGNLGTLSGYAIASTDLQTPVTSSAFPTRLSVANTIGSIDVINGISGLQVRSGSLGSLSVGGNVARASVEVSGTIGDIAVGKNVRGTTSISAVGDDGSIGSLVVGGGLFGSAQADDGFGVIAAGNIGATIATSGAIRKVSITDDLLTGATIRARRAIDQVIIGGDIEDQARIDAQSIGKLRIGGTNNGTIVRHGSSA